MSDLLAVDPGINSPGAALFRDGVLIAAADITMPASLGTSQMQRALEMSDAIMHWLCDATRLDIRIATLACEWPQVYAGSKAAANPNQLLGMVAVDAAVAFALSFIARQREYAFNVRTFLPAEWAGQLPKNTRKGKYWTSPRGLRIKSRLTDAEWAIASRLGHDGGDSVGIGLHALGRLGVRRALTSGRDAP